VWLQCCSKQVLTNCYYIQENCRVRKDNIEMEKAIAERLGYLQRYKVRLQHFLQLSSVFHIVCASVWFITTVRNN